MPRDVCPRVSTERGDVIRFPSFQQIRRETTRDVPGISQHGMRQVGSCDHTPRRAAHRRQGVLCEPLHERLIQRGLHTSCPHLAVPLHELEANAFRDRRGTCQAMQQLDHLARRRRGEIHLHLGHVRRIHTLGAEQLGESQSPITVHVVVGDVVREITAHNAIVGGDDHLLRRVELSRHLGRREKACPQCIANPTREGETARVPTPHRDAPAEKVADMTVDIRVHHVLRRSLHAIERVTKAGPIRRAL